MLSAYKKCDGYNMIELAAAMAVIAILTVAAVPSFLSMIGNSQIRSVTESYKNGLQLARAEAVKLNQQVRFKLNTDKSWTVGCVTVVTDKNGDGRDECPAVITKKAAKEGSSGNIQITRVGSDNVIFTGFGTVTTAAGQLSQIDINNTSLNATQVRKLRIRLTGGTARMCEPAITATTDPRRC